jgi:hypothetical protein
MVSPSSNLLGRSRRQIRVMLQVIDSGPLEFVRKWGISQMPCGWRHESKVDETITQEVRSIRRGKRLVPAVLSIAMLGPRISAASEDEGTLSLCRRSKGSLESPRVLDFSMPREATSLEETHMGPSNRSFIVVRLAT